MPVSAARHSGALNISAAGTLNSCPNGRVFAGLHRRCSKGHVLLGLSGELETTLADSRVVVLKPGMSYQVADNAEAHQSRTKTGAKLFIVD